MRVIVVKIKKIQSVKMFNTGGPSTFLLVMVLGSLTKAEIIKPYKEWLCNYCAMGKLMQYHC